MSARWLITFSGAGYEETTQRTVDRGREVGADEVYVYDDAWVIAHEFRILNRWLWDHHHKRGMGWYAWKPLIIQHALSRIEPGGIVLYVDGDTWPISSLAPIYETAERDGAMFFRASAHLNRPWCKRDCYIVMGQDDPKYYDAPAGCARFMAFKRGDWRAEQTLQEWLAYCVNPLATTFDPSVLGPELPRFQEHRTEQAILTLLNHKHGYTLYREACQDGVEFIGQPGNPGDYPQLFEQKHMGGVPHPTTGTTLRRIP